MKTYQDLVRDVLANGEAREDRTGTGTLSVFGRQVRFDLREGFPLLTTKRVFWRGVVAELLWFLSGSTDARVLQRQGVKIWDAWAGEDGGLGRIYGAQWRSWRGADGQVVDQIKEVVRLLREDPRSRRILVTAWNPAELGEMALPPCHCLFQFYVSSGAFGEPRRLSCHLYQRSADLGLGVPFNIASYALLTHLLAMVSGMEVGDFVHTFGDLHIYQNHVEGLIGQLEREPRPLPTLTVRPRARLEDFTPDDLTLEGYCPHDPISLPVSV